MFIPPFVTLDLRYLRDHLFLMPGVWAEWNVYGYEMFFDKFVWVLSIFKNFLYGYEIIFYKFGQKILDHAQFLDLINFRKKSLKKI